MESRFTGIQKLFALIRNDRGWSQAELAERAGLSKTTIELTERDGGPIPNLRTVDKLLGVYGLTALEWATALNAIQAQLAQGVEPSLQASEDVEPAEAYLVIPVGTGLKQTPSRTRLEEIYRAVRKSLDEEEHAVALREGNGEE